MQQNKVKCWLSETVHSSDKRTNESTLHIDANARDKLIAPQLWNVHIATGLSSGHAVMISVSYKHCIW